MIIIPVQDYKSTWIVVECVFPLSHYQVKSFVVQNHKSQFYCKELYNLYSKKQPRSWDPQFEWGEKLKTSTWQKVFRLMTENSVLPLNEKCPKNVGYLHVTTIMLSTNSHTMKMNSTQFYQVLVNKASNILDDNFSSNVAVCVCDRLSLLMCKCVCASMCSLQWVERHRERDGRRTAKCRSSYGRVSIWFWTRCLVIIPSVSSTRDVPNVPVPLSID